MIATSPLAAALAQLDAAMVARGAIVGVVGDETVYDATRRNFARAAEAASRRDAARPPAATCMIRHSCGCRAPLRPDGPSGLEMCDTCVADHLAACRGTTPPWRMRRPVRGGRR